MIGRAFIFIVSCFIGLCISTALLVNGIGLQAIPKNGYFEILNLKIVYPWLYIKWFYLYGNQFRNLFLSTIWPIYVFIILGVILAWISRLFKRNKFYSKAHGSSRWAHEYEINKSGLYCKDGVVLGKSKENNKTLRHNGPEHVLAVAPTRGGKGVGLVIPTLLEWQQSTVVFDPKGENWNLTSGYRSTIGQTFYFNPTEENTIRFNPLQEIRIGECEIKDTQNIADIIVDPDGRLETRNHWQNSAHSLLVGTILHVLYSYPRKSLAGVIEFLTRSGRTFENSLEDMRQSHHSLVKSIAQEMLNKHVEERSGVLSTAISMLAIFRDPIVAAATDEHDFSIESLKQSDKPISLYLVLPPSDISRLRVVIRIMLNQMGRVLTERQEEYKQRVLFLLDEFPALGRLEFFESALAYIAGYGLKAFLICQSLNQLQKVYGERNSILDNCHVRVAFANNDDQTAKRISALLGEQTLSKKQTSISGSRFAMFKHNASISDIEYARPLLLPAEINRLPQTQEIIFVNGLFPILANKIRYYSDKSYQNKVFSPATKNFNKTIKNSPYINSPISTLKEKNTVGSAL